MFTYQNMQEFKQELFIKKGYQRMTEQEKEQKIEELQLKKKELSPKVKEAFIAKNIASKTFTELNNKWLKLKGFWEDFDKEEKLLFFSMPGNKTVIKVKRTKDIKEKEKEKALKVLNNLPLEIREQVLANFK